MSPRASSRSASRQVLTWSQSGKWAHMTSSISPSKEAIRKAITTLKDLEGKTVVLGDLGWSSIVDPMVAQAGGDPSNVKYRRPVLAGWGQALQAGEADAALSWAGLRAQWKAGGLDFDYILGKDLVQVPGELVPDPPRLISKTPLSRISIPDTSRVGRWVSSSGISNPRAATQITMEGRSITNALNDTFPDKSVAVESMWQLADVYRGDWANRQGMGLARYDSLETFLTTIKEIGQLTKEIKAEDIIKNEYVAAATSSIMTRSKPTPMALRSRPKWRQWLLQQTAVTTSSGTRNQDLRRPSKISRPEKGAALSLRGPPRIHYRVRSDYEQRPFAPIPSRRPSRQGTATRRELRHCHQGLGDRSHNAPLSHRIPAL